MDETGRLFSNLWHIILNHHLLIVHPAPSLLATTITVATSPATTAAATSVLNVATIAITITAATNTITTAVTTIEHSY